MAAGEHDGHFAHNAVFLFTLHETRSTQSCCSRWQIKIVHRSRNAERLAAGMRVVAARGVEERGGRRLWHASGRAKGFEEEG